MLPIIYHYHHHQRSSFKAGSIWQGLQLELRKLAENEEGWFFSVKHGV